MLRGIAALVLFTAGLAAPATADTTPPELRSITFSRETAVVSGLETKLLAVSARLTDESGVRELPGSLGSDERFSPAVQIGQRWVRLTLSSGTPTDGVWTGGIVITTDWTSGTYRPDRVFAEDTEDNQLSVDPSTVVDDPPSVEVTSSDRPVLTLTFTPNPATVGGPLTRTVRVTNAAGRGIGGVPIALEDDNTCIESDIRTPTGRTNDDGVYSEVLPNGTHVYLQCAWITSDNIPEQPATMISPSFQSPTYRWSVTARPASSSVPAGTNVAVTGTLAPENSDFEVQLQRLYPDNSWRTVNRARTGANSGFSVLATPPGVGTYSYRVFAPASELRVANTSPVFTIRGT